MKIAYHHIRPSTRPGFTVAMQVDDDNHVHLYAVAVCHPKDNFCKKTGRMKATFKLQSPNHRCYVPFNATVQDLVKEGHFTVRISGITTHTPQGETHVKAT